MFDLPVDIAEQLSEVVSGFRSECFPGADAARLVDAFSRVERLAASGKMLAAGRVEETGSWKGSGERSSAAWFARRTGTNVGRAIDSLATVRRLDRLPGVEDALRNGRLSETQAKEVTAAAVCAPEREADLLSAAEHDSLSELAETCRKVRAESVDQEACYRRIHEHRSLRHWSDTDGTFRFDVRLTPDAGARIMTAVEEEANRFFEEARRSESFEPATAYQADALVALVVGDRKKTPKATVAVRVDHEAFVRGRTEPGEICEIDGVGPIPVSVARMLSNDAFIKVLTIDGTDIHTVSHMGRTIPARLRSALEERDPMCSVPGCSVRTRLEIDHIIPVCEGGPTELMNLARLCTRHHAMKTVDGWSLGGTPGHRTWDPPGGRSPDDPPRRHTPAHPQLATGPPVGLAEETRPPDDPPRRRARGHPPLAGPFEEAGQTPLPWT